MARGATSHGVHSIPTLPDSLTRSVGRNGWLEDWRLAAALLAVGVAVAARVDRARGPGPAGRPATPPSAAAPDRALDASSRCCFCWRSGAAVNAYAGYAPDLTTLRRTGPQLIADGIDERPAEDRRAGRHRAVPGRADRAHALGPGRPGAARRQLGVPAARLHRPGQRAPPLPRGLSRARLARHAVGLVRRRRGWAYRRDDAARGADPADDPGLGQRRRRHPEGHRVPGLHHRRSGDPDLPQLGAGGRRRQDLPHDPRTGRVGPSAASRPAATARSTSACDTSTSSARSSR